MIAAAMALACAGTAAHAATLDAALLPRVKAATFEVVAAKADDGKVVYEKPLPLDQMPYQERTDKYQSIGTAFAIGDNRFVTAWHVFASGVGSVRGPLSLRDEQGHVFAVDKVVKFSPQQDFVEFSLKQAPSVQPLEVERTPSINENVIAVGNALGTGVVLRDGLYTSDTPEEVDGRWKWMRFSAPASPGNSGGPLIDDKGKVIGVVLRKSPSENLNFALPISAVLDASDKVASIDLSMDFGTTYSPQTRHSRLREQMPLPLSQAEFYTRIAAVSDNALAKEAQAWLKERADSLWPQGDKSHELLTHSPWSGGVPALVVQDNGGVWMRTDKDDSQRSQLPNKGYIDRSTLNDTALWHIHSEADKPALTGGRAVGDALLTLGFITRKVGRESIKITSLGEPASTESFTDRQGRAWRVDAFTIPFFDMSLLTATTPTPDGAVGMIRMAGAGDIFEETLKMRMMADMEDIAYTGTLAQWQAFLANGTRPMVLRDAAFGQDAKGATLSVDGVKAGWPSSIVPHGGRSEVFVAGGWTVEDGKPVVRLLHLSLSQQEAPNAMVYIDRFQRPFADSSQDANNLWDELGKHAHPRDGKPFESDEWRLISKVYDPAQPKTASYIYTVSYAVRDKAADDDMQKRLAEVVHGTLLPGASPAGDATVTASAAKVPATP
jgi:S1-C subfamily serine protease